jgi:hypothetical protein
MMVCASLTVRAVARIITRTRARDLLRCFGSVARLSVESQPCAIRGPPNFLEPEDIIVCSPANLQRLCCAAI